MITKKYPNQLNDLRENIDFVVSVYHSQLKKDCIFLSEEFKKQLKNAHPLSEYLKKANNLFEHLVQRLDFHLIMEESVVFPMIQNAHTINHKLQNMLNAMEQEHQEDKVILEKIFHNLSLSQQHKEADTNHLLALIKKFQKQFDIHTNYEDENIFKTVYHAFD